MKKLFNMLAIVGVAFTAMVGCTTIKNLTPGQISAVSTVLTQTADQGAVYAIQQDVRNATYFKLANATIDTFVTGTDLSPLALQSALAKVPGATNQWIALATSAVVVAYDVSYQQYVSGQLTNVPAATAWVTAVETGFSQALVQTGQNATLKAGVKAGKPVVPYFVKADGKTLDKAAIKAKVKATKK